MQLLAQRLEPLAHALRVEGRRPGRRVHPVAQQGKRLATQQPALADLHVFVPDSRPRSLGCHEAQPLLHGGDDLGTRGDALVGQLQLDDRHTLSTMPVRHAQCDPIAPARLAQPRQQTVRRLGSQPCPKQIERCCGFARQTIQGKCQIQTGPRAGDLQAQRGTFGHSQRWDRTGDGLTARQLTFRAIERLQNLLKGKGRRDQQFELARLVEAPVIAVQRPLECLVFYRQRLAVAGVKRRERMRFAKRCADGGIAEGFAVAAARQEFCLQHFPLAQLRRWVEQWSGQHVEQTLERIVERVARYLEEKISVAFAGRRVELTATALHEGHQRLRLGIAVTAKKQ